MKKTTKKVLIGAGIGAAVSGVGYVLYQKFLKENTIPIDTPLDSETSYQMSPIPISNSKKVSPNLQLLGEEHFLEEMPQTKRKYFSLKKKN